MRWWQKAALHWTLARIPFGRTIHASLQEHVGELSQLENSTRFDNAAFFLDTTRKLFGGLDSLRVVEFGTGWVPAIPLTFMLAGARVQTFDVTKLVRPSLFRRCRREIERRSSQFARAAEVPLAEFQNRLESIQDQTDFSAAARKLGGYYFAPSDTCNLPVSENHADVVVSNLVLQCIPQQSLVDVLNESYRVIRPGGYAIHRVSLTDEYGASDPGRNDLEFLKYSAKKWDRYFNHATKHLNRLRMSQFLELFSDAGFDVERTEKVIDHNSVSHLQEIGVAEEFQHLSWEELCTTNFHVVLQKPGRVPRLKEDRCHREMCAN